MTESYYTSNRLKSRFLKMGCMFKKHPGGRFSTGWPDIEIRWKKEVINIEVKMDDRVVTGGQRKELKSIAQHGGYSIIIRKAYGKEIITGVDERSQAIAANIAEAFHEIDPKVDFRFLPDDPYVMNELKKIWEEK